jgi:hypothetical protein
MTVDPWLGFGSLRGDLKTRPTIEAAATTLTPTKMPNRHRKE